MTSSQNVQGANRTNRTSRTRRVREKRKPKASLLSRITGAVSGQVNTLKKEVKKRSSQVLGAMGVREASAQRKPPASPTAKAKEVREYQQRQELKKAAEPKTPAGKPFDVEADVTAFAKAGRFSARPKDDEIRELTWGRTPAQLEAINAVYKDRYGVELFSDLKKKLGPDEAKSAELLRQGKRVEAAAVEMRDATDGRGINKDRLGGIYDRLTPDEAKQATALFDKENPKGKPFSKLVSGDHANELLAFSQGRKEDGNMARMERKLQSGVLSGADGDYLIDNLRSMSPDKAKAYIADAKEKGLDIRALVTKNLDGTDRTEALALMDGNLARADAARVQDSIDGAGSNKNKLWDTLEVDIQDPKERAAYIEARDKEFNSLYAPPNIEARLRQEHSGETLQKTEALLKRGTLTPGERIRYSVNGVDEPEVAIELTQQLGAEKAQAAYAEATKSTEHPNGRNLSQDATSEFGGRNRFDMQDALKEPPKTREEVLARLQERAKFEDPDDPLLTALNPLSRLGGAFTSSDETMHKNNDRAAQALGEMKAAEERGDREAVAFHQARFDELTGYVKEDIKVFRGEKDGTVEVAAQVATTAAVVAATVATAGVAGPVLATTIVAGVGATANVGTRVAMQGGAYDQNNLAKDAAVGAMEGVGGKLGNVVGGAARSAMMKGAGELASSSAARNLLVRGGGMVVEGGMDGLVGGALSGAAEASLDKRTWNNGLVDGLLETSSRSAMGGALGMGTGMVAGPVFEVGLDGLGRGVRRLRGIEAPRVDANLGSSADDTVSARAPSGRTTDALGTQSDLARATSVSEADMGAQAQASRTSPSSSGASAGSATTPTGDLPGTNAVEPTPWRQIEVDEGNGMKVYQRVVPADDGGPAWTETLRNDRLFRKREVPSTDGGPSWSEFKDQSGQVRRLRSVPAKDGGPAWDEFQINERPVQRSRDLPAEDGGPDWFEQENFGLRTRRRDIPADDGGPAWSEQVDPKGNVTRRRSIVAEDGGPDWLEQVDARGDVTQHRSIPAEDGGPDWLESLGKDGKITRDRDLIDPDSGPEWVDEGWRQTREVPAKDGGPSWEEIKSSDGKIERQRHDVPARDGGPGWYETIGSDGKFFRGRKVPPTDGGPDWYESVMDGKLSRTRRGVPSQDGGPGWDETMDAQGRVEGVRTTRDQDGMSWVEKRDSKGVVTRSVTDWTSSAKAKGTQNFQLEGPDGPMEFRIHGEVNAEELATIRQAIEQMPPAARIHAREISVLPSLGDGINGMASRAEAGMAISRDRLQSGSNAYKTIHHEAGHYLDYSGQPDRLSSRPPWGSGRSVSRYGRTSPAEDFAEVHALVIGDWERYKNMSPAQWAGQTEAAKKMEIVRAYGGQVPDMREVDNAFDATGLVSRQRGQNTDRGRWSISSGADENYADRNL